jgi:hypothetical protein
MLTRSLNHHHHYHGRKISVFEPVSSLEYSARFVHSWLRCRELNRQVLTSVGFATILLLQKKVVSLASNPSLKDRVTLFISPNNTVALLDPQAPDFLLAVFCDSQMDGGNILILFHKE